MFRITQGTLIPTEMWMLHIRHQCSELLLVTVESRVIRIEQLRTGDTRDHQNKQPLQHFNLMLISSHCLSSIHKMPHSGHLRLCLYHNLGYGVTLSHCESPDSGLEILPTTNQDDSDD